MTSGGRTPTEKAIRKRIVVTVAAVDNEERDPSVCIVCHQAILWRDGYWMTDDGNSTCYLSLHQPETELREPSFSSPDTETAPSGIAKNR
jgi:hypothetical protein